MKPEQWLEEEEELAVVVREKEAAEEEGKAEGREGWREEVFMDICISSTDTPHSPMATWGEGGKEGRVREERGAKRREGEGTAEKGEKR